MVRIPTGLNDSDLLRGNQLKFNKLKLNTFTNKWRTLTENQYNCTANSDLH